MKELHENEVDLDLDDLYEGISKELNIDVDTSSGTTLCVRWNDYGTDLKNLDIALRAIVASKEPLYKPVVNRLGKIIFKETKLTKYFRSMKTPRAMYRPGCRFSEYLTLYFATAEKLGLTGDRFRFPDSCQIGKDGCEKASQFYELVETMQKEGNSKEFKKRVAAREEKSADNFKSAMDYEKSMFAWRSRLMVMRNDFGYHAKCNQVVTIAEARRDFKHFLNNSRKNSSLFGSMGGYIWKLEYGCDGKGFHFHVVFFYDGAKSQHDAYIAKQIGEYWVNTITKGRGNYHNCNQDKRQYKHLGIGMIHRDETEKRGALSKAIQYLTKKDHCMKLDIDGGRVFGKGGKPAPNLTNVGRPPKNGNSGIVARCSPVQSHANASICTANWQAVNMPNPSILSILDSI